MVNTSFNASLQPATTVKPFSPNNIKHSHKFPPKKSPFDLITDEVVKNLLKRAFVHITYIYNSIVGLSYFPLLRNFCINIMIQKPNKPPNIISSYKPIRLLPFFAKILEKWILKRILPIITDKKVLPDLQFGFRTSHSTVYQLNKTVDAISYFLKKQLYCTAVFLDISQTFDRMWHEGLLHKLKTFLPSTFYLLI